MTRCARESSQGRQDARSLSAACAKNNPALRVVGPRADQRRVSHSAVGYNAIVFV